ncbi:PspC domain-containing protein [Microbacterium rhizomatis]|nr:PspC domain-containing protein [Microbacterium rhizomatis]
MTDPTSAPPTTPPPPPPAGSAPTSVPTVSDRFFAWVTGFGVVRADGWLGGVCAGIAARLRIDPVIVRGIVAVTAVLGFPMLFLYATAWALLPDSSGRIHLQELLKSRFDPAMVGIGIMLIVSFVPAVPWIGAQLVPSWLWGGSSPVGLVLTEIGLALAVAVIILIARASARTRTPEDSETVPRTASAGASSSGAAGGSAGNGAPAAFPSPPPIFRAPAGEHARDAYDDTYADATRAPAPEPLAPAPGAPDTEIAAWRAQHDAWRAHNDAWRRQQQDADRAAREQARIERAAVGAAFAAEANERRRVERMSRPRASAGFVAAALGASLVVGAVIALASASATPMFAGAMGLFGAALVLALSMILAGAVRRRSGFLAFVTALVLTGATVAAFAPPVLAEIASYNMYVTNAAETGPVVQRSGYLFIDVQQTRADPTPIVVTKKDGDTYIQVRPGAAVDLRGTFGTTEVRLQRMSATSDEVTSEVVPPGDVSGEYALADVPVLTTQPIELDQTQGTLTIILVADGSPAGTMTGPGLRATPNPTPTSLPTPSANPEVTP